MIDFLYQNYVWISAAATILPLLYYYFSSPDYWEKRGIKVPKTVPIIGGHGLYLGGFSKPLHHLLMDWRNEYGNMFGIYLGGRPTLVISDPEMIKTVLVKEFPNFHNRLPTKREHPVTKHNLVVARDDSWKRIRAITSPTFTSGKMKKMYPLIHACTQEMVSVLGEHADSGKAVDLKLANGSLTMDVIAKCAFATEVNSHRDKNHPFLVNALQLFSPAGWRVALISILPKFLVNALHIDPAVGRDFFLDALRHVIEKRKMSPVTSKKPNDFLQLLLDAEVDGSAAAQSDDLQDENEAHHINEGEEEKAVNRKLLSVQLDNRKLSENEILAQSFVFFLAGYETTATTLSFCGYELARNPEVQEKLHQEVSEALKGNSERKIDYETLGRLPYLDAVLSETLRKHPPAMILAREAAEDFKFDNGIELKKGHFVLVPISAIHHDPANFPEPERFDPERFFGAQRDLIKPYSYIPFGGGPRNCIGMRFALLEAKLALSQLITRFKFVKCSQTPEKLEFLKYRVLLAAKNLMVGIERR